MSDTPHRHREWWTDERNAELVDLMLAGLPIEEVAARAGRTVDAIRGQCVNLTPPTLWVRKPKAFERLQELLLDVPGYDWRQALRDRAKLRRGIYWDADMNAALRDGFEQRRTAPELADELGISEVEVAQQLLRLGLAESSGEVVARLGADPHGTLAGQVRMREDRAASAVCVLIVDGAHGTDLFDASSRGDEFDDRSFPRHVSLHPDFAAAELVLDQIVADHVAGGGNTAAITAHIAERTLGYATIGAERQIVAPPVPLDEVPDFLPPGPATLPPADPDPQPQPQPEPDPQKTGPTSGLLRWLRRQ
ncbi:hypothetical protein B7C42_07696 [Nocardia cerradoensis]|uniref:Uncharacterized protein n=1 Tax=Nocardia cerradoensis TaxID=85688 RepID=A0A231GUW4_9NOCA|nr:hypothetical protein [Nocardia cerradoensis]OXR40271.1 hypothetical protein B7C42_07696 [Nocardia cerradoensis]